MNKSTIPYSIVEERRRLNKCIENAPNECEREIYRKIRDMKIPYDKLDTILETSKELIKEKEKQRKIKKRMLFLIDVSGFAAGICIFIFFCSKNTSILNIITLMQALLFYFNLCIFYRSSGQH